MTGNIKFYRLAWGVDNRIMNGIYFADTTISIPPIVQVLRQFTGRDFTEIPPSLLISKPYLIEVDKANLLLNYNKLHDG